LQGEAARADDPTMRLRVIDGGTRAPVDSQALWHGVAQSLRPGDDPALVFVTPAAPYVCLGYHQNAALEVDLAVCREEQVAVLRRRLGGGAVLLDQRQLIFHFVWPRALAPRRAHELYPRFLEPLVRAYRHLSIEAAYRPVNDLQVSGRKIAGAAAAEIGEAMVVGSMVLFDFDGQRMARLLRVADAKMRDKLAVALADYVTSLARLLPAPPSREAMRDLLVRESAAALGVAPEPSRLSKRESAAVAAEAASLAAPGWTARAGRKLVADGVKLAAGAYLARGLHKAPGGLIRTTLLACDGRIVELDIGGDFACLDPAAVELLGQRLAGAALDDAALDSAVGHAMRMLDLDMPGVSPADLATAILAARRESC
jgi:lipoate-protein ligase A